LGVTPDKVIWKVADVATAEDKSKKKLMLFSTKFPEPDTSNGDAVKQ